MCSPNCADAGGRPERLDDGLQHLVILPDIIAAYRAGLGVYIASVLMHALKDGRYVISHRVSKLLTAMIDPNVAPVRALSCEKRELTIRGEPSSTTSGPMAVLNGAARTSSRACKASRLGLRD